ncbi:hypothetical protein PQR64_35290 [Paraburkholderia phytofirmans]|uniref:hypothetical protein n=1 Tax=Paraburkholderia phytofirmans TaxID=261302 RepID=UPI0038BA3292
MSKELLKADSCAVAIIDYRPQMFFGTMSHERTNILHNVEAVAKAAKLAKAISGLLRWLRDGVWRFHELML